MRKCMYTKKIFRFLRPVCNFFLEILSQCGNVRPWTSPLFHPLHTHIHRWSIQSTLWMLMHGNEPADQQFLYQARGRQIQKLLSFFLHRRQDVCGWNGGYKGVISSLIHVVLWQCEESDIPCIHHAALHRCRDQTDCSTCQNDCHCQSYPQSWDII